MEDHIVIDPDRGKPLNLTKIARACGRALEYEEMRGWTTDAGAEVTLKVQDVISLMAFAGWRGF